MSAEGKKKHGISGYANAQNITFRYGGSKCDYSTNRRPGAAAHPLWAGSRLVQAFALGYLLHDKYPMNVSPILAVHVQEAMMRAPKAAK